MEINVEICNRTIKCSSGESSLLIHRRKSLNNFYFNKEQKQDNRDKFIFVAFKEDATSSHQRMPLLPVGEGLLYERGGYTFTVQDLHSTQEVADTRIPLPLTVPNAARSGDSTLIVVPW